MKYFLALALISTPFGLQAEIYRGVDKDGNVFYSDKEQTNSELIPTPTPNLILMPKVVKKKPVTEKVPENIYTAFNIITPEDDAAVRNNAGTLSIALAIEPELNTEQGDYIRLYIDDKVVVETSTELNHEIPNVDRGTHTLKAELFSNSASAEADQSQSSENKSSQTHDANSDETIEASSIMIHSVEFHMLRFSILNKR